MKIEDILLCVPRSLYFSTIGKMSRFELSEKAKEQAVKDGFYHFVRDESVADAIIESEYLRPSDRLTSYGKPCAFMFCGHAEIENFSKNLSTTKNNLNPYINPTMVADCIKFMPRSKNDLNNYKFRGLTDNVFMYEGHCILPHNAVQKVKMVPDLVRDSEGKPIKNEKGEYTAEFREAKEDELILPDKKEYKAKEDYLQFIKEKAIEYGYLKQNGEKRNSFATNGIAIVDLTRMEGSVMKSTVKNNWKDLFNSFIARVKRLKMERSTEDILKDFSFSKKNPYQDKKFAKYVTEIQTEQDLIQYDLNEVLPEFNNSKTGHFFNIKYNQIQDNIKRKGIHGKEHSNRVSMLAMMIAEKEGILKDDNNNRIKDILLTASMYHDIGRVLDQGPHARRGARKIAKMDLHYSDFAKYTETDKKIVMALVESHEGKPDKINKVLRKYGITNPEDIKLATRLNSVVRDADALDRVRLDQNLGNYKTNLNPQYLVNDTSKQFLNISYQLEYLTQKVPNMQNIIKVGIDETRIKTNDSKTFDERVKYDKEIVIDKQFSDDKKSKQRNISEVDFEK